VNAQIEFVLRDALRKADRQKLPVSDDSPDGNQGDETE
jgi:hypothetical protein